MIAGATFDQIGGLLLAGGGIIGLVVLWLRGDLK